jgi:protein involved in polysaccharide export with SLBB domain
VLRKLKWVAFGEAMICFWAFGASLAAPQTRSERSAPRTRRVEPAKSKKAQPRLEPLKEYVVDPPELLLVEVLEALPGRPISGERLVRPDGKISLGWYGEVYVAGLTPIEIKEKIVRHLRKFLSDQTLGLVETDGDTGKPVVDPDTGKTKTIDPKDTDRVFVDVTTYNSKSYYVQGMVASPGKIPVTGHDTVLDALNYAGGLTPLADRAHVVLYRPEKGRLRTLPIDVDQITMGDDLSTNYQLMPGDRLVVPQLPNTQPTGSKPESEPSTAEPPRRPNPNLYFDREPDKGGAPAHDVRPVYGDVDRAALLRLNQRMAEVERKLDLILEALKAPKE